MNTFIISATKIGIKVTRIRRINRAIPVALIAQQQPQQPQPAVK